MPFSSLASLGARAGLCGLLVAGTARADDGFDDEPGGPTPSARDYRPRGAPPPMVFTPSSSSAAPSVAPVEAPIVRPAKVRAVATQPSESEKVAAGPGKRPTTMTLQAHVSPRNSAVIIEAPHEIAVQRIPETGPHLFAPLAQVDVAGTQYFPYSFDGHVHSSHSPDADEPVIDMLNGAEQVGLSAMVITDHGSARSALSFPKYKGTVKAFVGQEVGGEYGHAVWWNVDTELHGRTTLAERAAHAHARGGLIVLCHPGWWIGGRAQDPMTWVTVDALKKGGISGDIDALELWNGVYDRPLPKLIAAWVDALEAGVYVPVVGNSDFHRFRSHRLGGPRNVVLCDKPDIEHCLWSGVKAGRSYITDGPTLNLVVNGKTYGEQVASGPLEIDLDTVSPRGGELRLYVGRAMVKSWPLGPDAREQLHWSGASSATPSYVRVEIVRSVSGYDGPIFELVSNPVFTR